MKSIWRIVKFCGELWRYYLAVSIFTILIAALSQVVPLLTKAAIDQITNLAAGRPVNLQLVALFAGLIFLTDIAQSRSA